MKTLTTILMSAVLVGVVGSKLFAQEQAESKPSLYGANYAIPKDVDESIAAGIRMDETLKMITDDTLSADTARMEKGTTELKNHAVDIALLVMPPMLMIKMYPDQVMQKIKNTKMDQLMYIYKLKENSGSGAADPSNPNYDKMIATRYAVLSTVLGQETAGTNSNIGERVNSLTKDLLGIQSR